VWLILLFSTGRAELHDGAASRALFYAQFATGLFWSRKISHLILSQTTTRNDELLNTR